MSPRVLVILTVVLATFCFQQSFGQSQQERNCQPHRICVFPGDYLTYSHWINSGTNDTVTYNFGNFVGNDKITVQASIATNETLRYNHLLVVDLNNGLTNVTRPDGSYVNIAVLVPVPVQYNKTEDSYEDTITFDGIKRKVVTFTFVDQFNSRDKEIDMETGILLSLHQTISGTGGKFFTTAGSLQLRGTNIIPSLDSQGPSQQSFPSSAVVSSPQNGTEFQWYLVIGLATGVGAATLYIVKIRKKIAGKQ